MSSETESNSSSAAREKRKRRSRNSNHRQDAVIAEAVAQTENSSKRLSNSTSSSRPVRSSSRHRREEEQSEPSFAGDDDQNNGSTRRGDYAESGKDDSSKKSLLEQLSVAADEAEVGGAMGIVRKFRLMCGQIVEDPRVQLFIIILIVINAIIMGIGTFNFVTDDPETDNAFETADKIFLIIFTVELALQLIYRSFTFFADSWLIFDFVIVIASWSLESLQIVRAFRIFRAFRLVTRIGPLRELVMAIGAVMPRMYAIAMLLFLIFYIFAVLFTELFSELELSDNYFGSLDVSLFTCMEMMTLEWADVTRQIMEEKSWAWAPLVAFIAVTGFIVFNLIVAVVCDAVAVVDREAMAEKHPEMLTDKQKLEEAQERIWELTETVEILMMRQERLLSVADMLSQEVRSAVMSPVAAAVAPSGNPALRSAMKNSGRNPSPKTSIVNRGPRADDVLHFSDRDDDDISDMQSDPLENTVQNTVNRISRGSKIKPPTPPYSPSNSESRIQGRSQRSDPPCVSSD